jgi:hypothetical protein
MRKLYKIAIVISLILIFYLSIRMYEDSMICPEALKIRGNDTNQTDIIEKIVRWMNDPKNFNNVYSQVSSNDLLTKTFYGVLCKPITSEYWYIFMVRCGSCGEMATLYDRMAECVNIPNRIIQNYDRDHEWDESFIYGKWTHVDPSMNVFNNTSYYGNNFSSLIAIYDNGTIEDVTNRYVKTGRLIVFVTDGTKPLSNVKVTVKTSLFDITNYTGSNGIHVFDLGVNNYTIISESGFLIGLSNEKKMEVKANDSSLAILYLNNSNKMIFLMSDTIDRLNALLIGFILIVVSMLYITHIFLRAMKMRKK